MEHRILIHTPTGKDGRLISGVFERSGLECLVCASGDDMMEELGKGAGALLVADEALTSEFLSSITHYLRLQHAWSDLPILVLSKRGLDSPEMRSIYFRLGNVTLLERPVQSVTLVSAATSALRARRRQYEMRDVDRRKDEFLAMLAHELRNPLAPISAASDLLRFVDLDRKRIEQTSAIISRQVGHMTGLIDDLLDVSRVSRGLVTIDRSLLDVRRIVGSAVEQVRPLIDARQHRLTVQTPAQPALVQGDQKRLIQVVTNLLNNAAKYSPERSRIVLSVDLDPGNVTVRVVDNGIGISADVIGHVFEMFTQAERTPDRSQGGLGIGLALVKSLVDLHDGEVGVESAGLGQGSTFTVVLPRIPESATRPNPQNLAGLTRPAQRRRLLVVDDNVDAARLLCQLLEAAGHEVMIEHDAHHGLARAQSERPDACLLDIGLPDMDGNTLARELRNAPATAGCTLIAITGYGQEQDRTRSAQAGFDHHFVKPVNLEQLLGVLASLP